MARAKKARPWFGVFAEGSHHVDPGLPTFESLWRELCQGCDCGDDIRVYGFSKKQIVLLNDEVNMPPRIGWSAEPLDILISRMHARDRFDNVIIAFDRWPKNQAIISQRNCLRSEVNFILESIGRRGLLPKPFLAATMALLQQYISSPKQPRDPGRPPFGPLELIFMDPMFEALLVHDDTAFLHALELKRRPHDWPKFHARSRNPGQQILDKAIKSAARTRKVPLRPFDSDKHGWALKTLRAAGPSSKLWAHPIAERLRILLA